MTKRRARVRSDSEQAERSVVPDLPAPTGTSTSTPRSAKTPPAGAESTTLPRGIRPARADEYGRAYIIGGQAPSRRR
jgi:hypothetical protein